MLTSIALETSKGLLQHDERQLIERARHDSTALSQLYRQHYAAIHKYVLHRVGDQHDADEITAEVFLNMVRSLSRFRWQGVPFRAWLYRIATNQVNRWATRRRRRGAIEQLTEQLLAKSTTETLQDDHWDAELVQLALISLSPRFQAVLSLFYLEEMPIAEIAEVLGCRPGTVKSRLSRGRDLLRKYLSNCEGSYGH